MRHLKLDRVHGSHFWKYYTKCAKKLFEKVEMKQEPVRVSDTRKIDLSIMSFWICYLAAQRLKDLYNGQRQKMNKTSVLKHVTCKNFELWKWPILATKMSKWLHFLI